VNDQYENVFIIDDMQLFESNFRNAVGKKDLVLTFDFALYRSLSAIDREVYFIDKICDREENQRNNHLLQRFISNWFRDENGESTVFYDDVCYGSVLRLNVANDIIYSVRLYKCLEKLATTDYHNLVVASREHWIVPILKTLQLGHEIFPIEDSDKYHGYFFPIDSWLGEKLGRQSFVKRFCIKLLNSYDLVLFMLSRLRKIDRAMKRIYVHEYHSTKSIINVLQNRDDIEVVLGDYSVERGLNSLILRDRRIPQMRLSNQDRKNAQLIADRFMSTMTEQISSVNENFNRLIKHKIYNRILVELPEYLRKSRSLNRFIENKELDLVVLISDQGPQELVRLKALSRGIPSFLIINGLMSCDFSDEAKSGDWINCYSDSIRDSYYKNSNNVHALGDPRMDRYALEKMSDNTECIDKGDKFVIAVGAAGFNHLDLNSYCAFEFEFLDQVLLAIQEVTRLGYKTSLKLLVRGNGYICDYQKFVDEYFLDLEIEILQGVAITKFLDNANLYVSFYSQTLFEASCLGIPVVYHKADREQIHSPFDGKSELVTTHSIIELTSSIVEGLNLSNRFEKFLDRTLMENYIGPLNGNNTKSNIEFIDSIFRSKDVI
jgi:hypothetical protein